MYYATYIAPINTSSYKHEQSIYTEALMINFDESVWFEAYFKPAASYTSFQSFKYAQSAVPFKSFLRG